MNLLGTSLSPAVCIFYLLLPSSAGSFLEGDLGSWNVLCLLGAGVGDIGVVVEDPQGKNTVELLVEDRGNQVYRCVYKPVQPGPHVVKVSFAGDTIPKSPFIVQVGEGECQGS